MILETIPAFFSKRDLKEGYLAGSSSGNRQLGNYTATGQWKLILHREISTGHLAFDSRESDPQGLGMLGAVEGVLHRDMFCTKRVQQRRRWRVFPLTIGYKYTMLSYDMNTSCFTLWWRWTLCWRLSQNGLSPKLFVICDFLSSEYQVYACGKKLQMPRFWTGKWGMRLRNVYSRTAS